MSEPLLLVIEHQADCPPAHLGRWLEESGCRLEVCRPYAGDAIPDLASYDGLLVLGGPMGANDDATSPWLTPVKALIRDAAERDLPVLGVCLGHQLAAVALGGVAGPNPQGHQIGLVDTHWTEEAAQDPLVGGAITATRAVHWNLDLVLEPPADATILARTLDGAVQAARFAPSVWGVQWHPEVDDKIFGIWADEDREQTKQLGIDDEQLCADIAAAGAELDAAWRPLGTGFAALVAARR